MIAQTSTCTAKIDSIRLALFALEGVQYGIDNVLVENDPNLCMIGAMSSNIGIISTSIAECIGEIESILGINSL